MKTTKYVLALALGLIALVVPRAARADTFNLTFTCDPSITCLSVPTAPAVSFPSPTITETWDTLFFTITLPAIDTPGDTYHWINKTFDDLGRLSPNLNILDSTTGTDTFTGTTQSSPQNQAIIDQGVLTFTPVATPEPPAGSLMLLGLGLVLLLRKRNSRGHQLAT